MKRVKQFANRRMTTQERRTVDCEIVNDRFSSTVSIPKHLCAVPSVFDETYETINIVRNAYFWKVLRVSLTLRKLNC
jgi:hypothetical protein